MINNFETGGSERQFTLLAEHLKLSKFRVHVACINRRGPLGKGFEDIAQFGLGTSAYGLTSLGARFRLARYLRRNAVNIAHAFGFYPNLTMIPAARLAGVPVVLGSHRQLGDLMPSRQFWTQIVALRWCDTVVCNSRAAANRLATAGIKGDKLAVIGNGSPESAFEVAVPVLPRSSCVLRVGMVARMNAHYKNHIGFLRIAAEIHRRRRDVEFLLVGDGPLRADLERQAANMGIGAKTIFVGDRRDVPNLLASTDVAVLTSKSESLSNAILEAMAARLPVVAYNVGGNAELINAERGILVSAEDEAAFTWAVLRLLSNSDLRNKLGSAAHSFAQENFSINRVSRQYEEIYARLAGSRNLHNRG